MYDLQIEKQINRYINRVHIEFGGFEGTLAFSVPQSSSYISTERWDSPRVNDLQCGHVHKLAANLSLGQVSQGLVPHHVDCSVQSLHWQGGFSLLCKDIGIFREPHRIGPPMWPILLVSTDIGIFREPQRIGPPMWPVLLVSYVGKHMFSRTRRKWLEVDSM